MMSNRKVEPGELNNMVRVWHESLSEIIPLEKLSGAFKRAMATHQSSFPVNAFDILKNFHELEAEEKDAARKESEKPTTENRVKNCIFYKEHKDDALRPELIGGIEGEEVLLPCPVCRPSQYDRRRREEYAKYRAKHGQEPVTIKQFIRNTMIDLEEKQSTNRFKTMSAGEIIASRRNLVGLEAANMPVLEEREKLHQAFAMLVSAEDYLQNG
jgi:hypothetical protein